MQNQERLKKYTRAVNYRNFSAKWLKDKCIYSSFKILEIEDCLSLRKALQLFLQKNIINALKSCPYLIVITICENFKDYCENDEEIKRFAKTLQPIIVEIKSATKFSTFYCAESNLITQSSDSPTLTHYLREKIKDAYSTLDAESIAEMGLSFDVQIFRLLREPPAYNQLLREVEAAIKSEKITNFEAVLDFPIK